jgi:hypothetical protein
MPRMDSRCAPVAMLMTQSDCREQWPSAKSDGLRSLDQMQTIGQLYSEIRPMESESIIFDAAVVGLKGYVQ